MKGGEVDYENDELGLQHMTKDELLRIELIERGGESPFNMEQATAYRSS